MLQHDRINKYLPSRNRIHISCHQFWNLLFVCKQYYCTRPFSLPETLFVLSWVPTRTYCYPLPSSIQLFLPSPCPMRRLSSCFHACTFCAAHSCMQCLWSQDIPG